MDEKRTAADRREEKPSGRQAVRKGYVAAYGGAVTESCRVHHSASPFDSYAEVGLRRNKFCLVVFSEMDEKRTSANTALEKRYLGGRVVEWHTRRT